MSYQPPTRHQCGDCGSTNLVRLPCTVEGCDRPLLADGYCSMHYNRVRRTGRVEGMKRGTRTDLGYTTTKEERSFEIDPNDGFWDQVAAYRAERMAARL